MHPTNRYGLNRSISEGVKRAVRRRCQFGCVVCGSAIYQFHHFDPPFEQAEEHRSEGITLLCGTCHDQVTRGFWSSEKIAEHNRVPYCRTHPAHALLDLQAPIQLLLGSILLTGVGPLLKVDGHSLLSIARREAEGMALSAMLIGDGGVPVVRIEKNELVLCAAAWDVRVVGRSITFRHGAGDVALDVVVHPPNGLHVRRLDLAYRGITLDSDERGRVELRLSGRPAIDLHDYVMHVGGCIDIGRDQVTFTGGSALVPFPSSRLAELAKNGDFQTLALELRAPTLHVIKPPDTEAWCVKYENGEPRPIGRLDEARAWATGMCMWLPGLRAIVHLSNGALEFLPKGWRGFTSLLSAATRPPRE